MWTAFSNSVVPGGTPGRDFRLRVGRALLEAKSLLGDAGFCQPFGSLFGFLCIKKSILSTCVGIRPRALHIGGKFSTTELHPQNFLSFKKII